MAERKLKVEPMIAEPIFGLPKQPTVVVVWSDHPIAGLDRMRRVIDALGPTHSPWAVARFTPGGSRYPIPVCHSASEARRWLSRGHGLIYAIDASLGEEAERQALSLAAATNASILPAYFAAGCDAGIRLGSRINPATFARFEHEHQQVQLLRWRGQALRYRRERSDGPVAPASEQRIAAAVSPAALAAEVDALPAECKLLTVQDCQVFAARAQQIPMMLREIGRQREITFRAAGEGTGRAEDLDVFDQDYYHLFAFSSKQRALLGAYRLGLVDELIAAHGVTGLYTNTLFHFAPDLFDHLGPTIELGRSFICPQYQQSSRALIWLWRGIASFVAARPAYRTLLGPVSVSAQYGTFSREVMVRVLTGLGHRHWLHESVRAKHPVLARSFGTGGLGDPRTVLCTVADLQAVVSDAEGDRKGIPLLVKEYLRLGGKVLDFNLDPNFANVIDGLVVVDLLQTDRRLLSFYMGDLLEGFLGHHRASA